MTRLPRAVAQVNDVAEDIQRGIDEAAQAEPSLTERTPIHGEIVQPETPPDPETAFPGVETIVMTAPLPDDHALSVTEDAAAPTPAPPPGPDFESARAITAAMATPFTQVLCRIVNGGDRWTPIEEFIAQRIRNLAAAYVTACRDGGTSPIMVNASIDMMIKEMEESTKAALRGGAKP